MNANQPTPKNYEQAERLLTERSRYQDKPVKLANNTYLHRVADDAIAVRFHATDVVTFYADNVTELDSGGYRTQTTLERLNRYLPNRTFISQQAGTWLFAQFPNADGSNEPVTQFEDGLAIDSVTGEVVEFAEAE